VQQPKVDESSGETPVMVAEQVKLLLKQPNVQTLLGARNYAILCFLFYAGVRGVRIGSPGSTKIKDFYQGKFKLFR
jgi:site-specific recombinase XerD